MVRTTTELGREVRAVDSRLTYNYVAALTELSRELFCSSEGALIDQSFALTQGMAYVVGDGDREQPGYLRRASGTSAAGRS